MLLRWQRARCEAPEVEILNTWCLESLETVYWTWKFNSSTLNWYQQSGMRCFRFIVSSDKCSVACWRCFAGSSKIFDFWDFILEPRILRLKYLIQALFNLGVLVCGCVVCGCLSFVVPEPPKIDQNVEVLQKKKWPRFQRLQDETVHVGALWRSIFFSSWLSKWDFRKNDPNSRNF